MRTIDELGVIFADALAEVVGTMTGAQLVCLPQEDDAGLFDISGAMFLRGETGGMLFISANEPDIRILCSGMIGVAKEEATQQDIEDALCEFVNMTAGNVKLRLSDPEHAFTLSSPFIIRGRDVSVAVKNKKHAVTRIAGDGEVYLKLKFVC